MLLSRSLNGIFLKHQVSVRTGLLPRRRIAGAPAFFGGPRRAAATIRGGGAILAAMLFRLQPAQFQHWWRA